MFKQIKHKSACLAAETSQDVIILHVAGFGNTFPRDAVGLSLVCACSIS